MKTLIYTIIFLILSINTKSQDWKRKRYEMNIGWGLTKSLCDLGDLGLCSKTLLSGMFEDFDTRKPMVTFGLSYQFTQNISARINFSAAQISANDNSSKNVLIENRNLNFTSKIMYPGIQVEYYFWTNRLNTKYYNRKSSLSNKIDMYLIGGTGMIYFHPEAELDGIFYDLRDIGTEGQGLDGQKKKYDKLSFTWHYGFGLKLQMSRLWAWSIELYCHHTQTDYLDDVSSVNYFNFDEQLISGQMEEDDYLLVKALNDRRNTDDELINSFKDASGWQKRGFKGNDAYVTTAFSVIHKLNWGWRRRTIR